MSKRKARVILFFIGSICLGVLFYVLMVIDKESLLEEKTVITLVCFSIIAITSIISGFLIKKE